MLVVSPPGEGTRQRPDGGARQRFFCRPGVFLFHPSGGFFSFLSSSFFFFFGAFVCVFALALSPNFFCFSFVCLFLYFFTFSLLLLFLILFLCFFVFLFFLSHSVYRGSWRMYVAPGIAQHNSMALYYCCPPGTT